MTHLNSNERLICPIAHYPNLSAFLKTKRYFLKVTNDLTMREDIRLIPFTKGVTVDTWSFSRNSNSVYQCRYPYINDWKCRFNDIHNKTWTWHSPWDVCETTKYGLGILFICLIFSSHTYINKCNCKFPYSCIQWQGLTSGFIDV